ncbi:MAG: hypothetical protein A07HB70_01370 [uncultured archaeon A07HB70]|nr:MAG: hypothetical protein A07HB70_01370 [uncultured archaeon A07HB70]
MYARPGTPRAIRQKPVWTYWLGASALGIATNVGAGSRRTAGVAVRTAVQETAPIQYGVTLPWLAICAGGSSCQRSIGAAVPRSTVSNAGFRGGRSYQPRPGRRAWCLPRDGAGTRSTESRPGSDAPVSWLTGSSPGLPHCSVREPRYAVAVTRAVCRLGSRSSVTENCAQFRGRAGRSVEERVDRIDAERLAVEDALAVFRSTSSTRSGGRTSTAAASTDRATLSLISDPVWCRLVSFVSSSGFARSSGSRRPDGERGLAGTRLSTLRTQSVGVAGDRVRVYDLVLVCSHEPSRRVGLAV